MMSNKSRWLFVLPGAVFCLIVVASLAFISTRDLARAPTQPVYQPAQNPKIAVLEEPEKVDDNLMDGAFAGKEKAPFLEEPETLRVGQIPLSKAHPSAGIEVAAADALAQKRNWGAAHAKYITAIDQILHDKHTSLDSNWLSVCFGVIGVCLAEENKVAIAVQHLNNAIKVDPSVAENYIVRGNLYKRMRRDKDAAADFEMSSKTKFVLSCYPGWAKNLEICKVPRSFSVTKQR